MKRKLYTYLCSSMLFLFSCTCNAAYDIRCEIYLKYIEPSPGIGTSIYFYPEAGSVVKVREYGQPNNFHIELGSSADITGSGWGCVRGYKAISTDLLDLINNRVEALTNKISESDENYKKQIEILSAKIASLQLLQADMLQMRVNAIEQALRDGDEPDNSRLNDEIKNLKEMIKKLISINSK